MSPRLFTVEAPDCGLRAFIVIDSTRLGPAAGGVRTRAYASEASALEDVHALARAMTLKCAIAGLDAGGAKCVVMDHPGLDRPRAFAKLGAYIEDLGGLFRTAGDVGTRQEDLEAMAQHCAYVHLDETGLTDAVAMGVVACLEGLADLDYIDPDLSTLRATVQGCGAIGSALARTLNRHDATLILSDINPASAHAVASAIGAEVCGPAAVWSQHCDVLAPCAVGGLLTAEVASRVAASAVCGAANNILSARDAERVLMARDVIYVPDFISSSGAVIRGISRTVMMCGDGAERIAALRRTTRDVLELSRQDGITATEAAIWLAESRLSVSA